MAPSTSSCGCRGALGWVAALSTSVGLLGASAQVPPGGQAPKSPAPSTMTPAQVSSACQALVEAYVAGNGTMEEDARSATAGVGIDALARDEAVRCAEAALSHSNAAPMRTALFVERVARHPACAEELETKSEAQTRCAQKLYKIAVHTLMVAGQGQEAEAMFKRAKAMNADSPSPMARISWPSVDEMPTVWISGLRSKKVWDCSSWPFVRRLEAAAQLIREEIEGAAERFQTAYPYLTRSGTWQDMFLFRGTDWDPRLCEMLPTTCRLLLPELPTKPGVPYATAYHEEVVIFRSEPGAFIGEHCGSSNAVVNLHLTLKGARGTILEVAGEEFPLQDGKAFCFQDSYFHAVEHRGDGDGDRLSLVIRVMHPELSLDAYRPSNGTDVVPEFANYDQAAVLQQEVGRLREAFRQLAAAAAPPLPPAGGAGAGIAACARSDGGSRTCASP